MGARALDMEVAFEAKSSSCDITENSVIIKLEQSSDLLNKNPLSNQ